MNKAQHRFGFQNYARLSILLLLAGILFAGFTQADGNATGFRNSFLAVQGNHLMFSSDYMATISVKVNGVDVQASQLQSDVYFQKIRNDSFVSRSPNGTLTVTYHEQIDPGFKFNFTLGIPQTSLQGGAINNASVEVSSARPFFEMGGGVLSFPRARKGISESGVPTMFTDYDLWNFGDVISGVNKYNLVTSESMRFDNATGLFVYALVLKNFQPNMQTEPGSVIFLDPTISVFSASRFSNGAFNNTYVNDSQNVFTIYYAGNSSFSPSGTYFSQPLILNHSAAMSVSSVNWSWFEAIGFNASDAPLVDLHFENDSKDAGPYNNSGVISNYSATTFVTGGQVGQAVKFDGVNGKVNVSYAPSIHLDTSMTVSAWFKVPANLASGIYVIADESGQASCGSNGGFELIIDLNGKIKGCIGNGGLGAAPSWEVSSAISANVWHQIIYTWNSSGPNMYFDGVNQTLTSSDAGTQPLDTHSSPLVIGQSTLGSSPFNGSIDEVHVWNRTVNSSEATSLFNWEKGGGTGNNGHIRNFTNVSLALRAKKYSFNDSGLVGWWDLGDSSANETALNVSLDLSGNGNNAVMHNSPPVLASGCVIGSCLNFSGSSAQYLEVPFSPSLNLSGALSLAFWIDFPASALMEPGIAGTTYLDGYQCTTYNGQVWCYIGGIGGNAVHTGSLALNAWHHVVLTWDGTENANGMSVYADGVLSAQRTSSVAILGNTRNFMIGRHQAAYLNGSVDDVKVWNRAISATEVSNLYNSGNPTNSAGQESNWTAFTGEYYAGNATPSGVSGNIVQYRARFSTSSANFTAFLQNVSVSYGPFVPVLSISTVPQPMTVYGYFAGANANSIVNVTAYMDGVLKGAFQVTTTGQYGLFDVQGNNTDYGQTLTLKANNSAIAVNTTAYGPGSTTEVDIAT